MKKTKVNRYTLSNKQILWILLSVVIAVLPHFQRLPVWFPLLLFLVVLTRWLTGIRKIKPMPALMIAFVTIFIFIAIIYFQGFKLNREISVTLLTTMTVLKLLETWRKRDAWMVVTLCYFVILTRFFYSQDMILVLYLLLSVIVITHSLFVLQHDSDDGYFKTKEIKQTLSLLMIGLPLAVMFFLFFPRLGSPIWGSPDFFGEGKTGMSDEMSPGSISQLFSDDSTAFRVTFDGATPENSKLYWRGPVLWDFDGKTWKRNNRLTIVNRPKLFSQPGNIITYEVELEPTGQHYMFALDYLISAPIKSGLISDFQLMSQNKINQLRHYTIQSTLKTYNSYEVLSIDAINQLKRTPKGYNPRTTEMIEKWKKLNLTPEQIILKALNLFNKDEFYYSYSPPLLFGDTIDQFLFETKSGFCEHYASAFTIMMREAGLPARVVTGYQGGIQNEGYLLVKQSDAHAWSEVWISGKGWLRVDPTAAVSPLRVERGSQALMSQNARHWYDSGWYRKLGERYDGMRHKWNIWVRDYNAVRQEALFKIFGFDSKQGKSIATVLGLIMLLSTLIVLLFLYIVRPKRKLTAYDNVYNKLIKVFDKKGLKLKNGQGILSFTHSANKRFPQVKESINEFADLYLKLRFSKQAMDKTKGKNQLNELIKTISKNISITSSNQQTK